MYPKVKNTRGGALPIVHAPPSFPRWSTCQLTIFFFFLFLFASHTTGTTLYTYATLPPARSASGPARVCTSSYPSASRMVAFTVITNAPTRRCGRTCDETTSVPGFTSQSPDADDDRAAAAASPPRPGGWPAADPAPPPPPPASKTRLEE